MSDTPIDYDAVLTDLEARRAKLDAAIAAVREIRGLPAADGSVIPPTDAVEYLTPHTFFSLSIPAAVRKYLQIVKAPKTAIEISKALQDGGLTSTSKTFYTTVYTAMSRDDERGGEIMKLNDGKWGLAAWFPGAQRKKKLVRADEPADE